MDKVILFGNGQMASMIHFYLTHDSPYEVAAFTVDGDQIKEETLLGLPVTPFEEIESRYPPSDPQMLVSISYRDVNQLRAAKYSQAKAKGYRLINYISTRAMIWPGLVIGDNCIVLEGAVIQPYAEIGSDVFIGCGSLVSHNCVIGDHCFVAPGAVALGYVRVGSHCLLGANSTIRDGVTVASDCVIGSGVTIRRNTEPKQVYIGEEVEPLTKGSDELRQWLTWAR